MSLRKALSKFPMKSFRFAGDPSAPWASENPTITELIDAVDVPVLSVEEDIAALIDRYRGADLIVLFAELEVRKVAVHCCLLAGLSDQ